MEHKTDKWTNKIHLTRDQDVLLIRLEYNTPNIHEHLINRILSWTNIIFQMWN